MPSDKGPQAEQELKVLNPDLANAREIFTELSYDEAEGGYDLFAQLGYKATDPKMW